MLSQGAYEGNWERKMSSVLGENQMQWHCFGIIFTPFWYLFGVKNRFEKSVGPMSDNRPNRIGTKFGVRFCTQMNSMGR